MRWGAARIAADICVAENVLVFVYSEYSQILFIYSLKMCIL